MSVNHKYLLYSLANTFNISLGIEISKDTKNYLSELQSEFIALNVDDKIYYGKYAIELATKLNEYFEKINLFEINQDSEIDFAYDFKIRWKKNNITYICMSHNDININNIIPEKIMKICKYKKNTNIYKIFTEEYQKIIKNGYNHIKNKKKYSDLNNEDKNEYLIYPICKLIYDTLSKKRKCAPHLYHYLYDESDRVVLKLYKNRFVIYDFGKKIDDPESFRMEYDEYDTINIKFNNDTKFVLVLQTNASEIKEHISLKFHTTFQNMDELYVVSSSSI